MSSKNVWTMVMVLLVTAVVSAQPGTLDTTFDTDGRRVVHFDIGGEFQDLASGLALQPDGKIVVAGSAMVEKIAGSQREMDFAVARLNTNGSLDSSFGAGGKQSFAYDGGQGNGDSAWAMTLQADGKILIAGSVERSNTGDRDMAVLRVRANGTRDTTFGSGGWAIVPFDLGGQGRDEAFAIGIQADGKIVIAGEVERNNGDFDMAAARLTPSGMLDTSFGQGGKAPVYFDLGGDMVETAYSLAIQDDGKILLAGQVKSAQDNEDFGIARLTANGALDPSFDGDGRQVIPLTTTRNDFAFDVALQSDGKIVAVGWASTSSSGNLDFAAVRLTTSGALDTGFGSGGKQIIAFDQGFPYWDTARSVAIQNDGKILIGGTASWSGNDDDYAVARLTSSGQLDSSFGSGGKRTYAFDLGSGNEDDFSDLVILEGSSPKAILLGEVNRQSPGDTDFGIVKVNL